MQIKDIQLFGDRVLIKPLKEYTYTIKEKRPKDKVPTGVNEMSKDYIDTPVETETEEVDVEVKSSLQKATVVAIGTVEHIPCKVGDTVVYHIKSGIPFELVKGHTLLKHYDIIGVINK